MKMIASFVCGLAVFVSSAPAGNINFNQINLVSDIPGVALNTDPNLVNPWGVSFSGGSPIWVADNGSGLSTLYNGAGTPQALVVTVPPPGGGTPPSAPTGTVFNPTSANFGGALFLFDTEDGTISSWSGGTNAAIKVDNSPAGAVYKGMTIAGNNLYVTNFNSGAIEEYNSSFGSVSTTGKFTDAAVPAGFAPFNIQDINGNLYVTYALQDPAKHDDVAGPGNGYVAVYDPSGTLLSTLISQGALNSPWGLAVAPAGFGSFGGDLLVGNFGDGSINAFDISSGAFKGTLDGANGLTLVNQGLWSLFFGNGAQGTSTGTLYITAGIPGPGGQVEDHGLLAAIAPVPEPSTFALVAIGFGMSIFGLIRRRRRPLA